MQLHKVTLGATNCVASRLACEIFNIRGTFNGADETSFLQIHDASQLPADTAVPVFSIPLGAAAYYSWDWPRGLQLSNGCIAVVSTTQATLTISAETADFFVDGTAALVLDTPSVVGDLTTDLEQLDIVSADSHIYQIKVHLLTDHDLNNWVHIFVGKLIATLQDGDIPTYRHKFPLDTANTKRTFSFGAGGLRATQCVVAVSSTGPAYLATGTGDGLAVEAIYKAV